MEVTGINRQSYMAEVSQLLELITDGETRERLIAQMEQMFDAAEDEKALIEQIGSPTKVAVALIRFADTKKAEAAESVPEVPAVQEPAAAAAEPEEEPLPAPAFEEPSPEAEFDDDVMPESAYDEELPAAAYDEELPAAEAEADVEEAPAAPDELLAEIESAVMQETGEAETAEAADDIEAAFETAFTEPEPAEEVPAEAAPTEAEAFQAESEAEAANVPDLAEALRRAEESDGEPTFDPGEASEELEPAEDEPEVKTRVIGWRVFLYLLVPGIVIGLPIFLALFAISLVLLAVGAAAVAAAVGVISSAFVGFTVVADLLLVLGAGLSVFAIALVILWFAIWFLIAVTFGWVRLMTRGGLRFTRKEVPVE